MDEAYIDFGGDRRSRWSSAIPTCWSCRPVESLLAGRLAGRFRHPTALVEALDRVKNSFNSYPLDRLRTAGAVAAYQDEAYFQQTRRAIIDSRERWWRTARARFETLPSQANFVFARHPQHDACVWRGLARAALGDRAPFPQPRIDQYLRITVGTDQVCAALTDPVRNFSALHLLPERKLNHAAAEFAPPFTAPTGLPRLLRKKGYGVLSPAALVGFVHTSPAELGRYARAGMICRPTLPEGRRPLPAPAHASFVVEAGQVRPGAAPGALAADEYNALHGGMQRCSSRWRRRPWRCRSGPACCSSWARSARRSRDAQPWYVEAHQFRIDTTDGIGRPTPEGAHRDGVDFVAVLFVGRANQGRRSRVFGCGPQGQRFTLTEPWTCCCWTTSGSSTKALRCSPVGEHGYRDTLVLTFRKGGFLEEA